jgi:signal transduction histidine kinase
MEALTQEIAALSVSLHRERTVEAVLSATANVFESHEFDVVVLQFEGAGYQPRWISGSLADMAREVVSLQGGSLPNSAGAGLFALLARPEPTLVADLPAALARWLTGVRAPPEALALAPRLKQRVVVAGLPVDGRTWGALLLMHDALEPAHLAMLSGFVTHLCGALERVWAVSELERRGAELDLVHALAVAGPRADVAELSKLALGALCRNTRSQAGMLHRYEPADAHFVLVGEPVGYQGPLVPKFRRFRVLEGSPIGLVPRAMAVDDLVDGALDVRQAGFLELAVVPLVVEGKPVGMITLARRQALAFSPEELRSAEILGLQIAAQLERMRLYDEASKLYVDLKKSYDDLARTQAELVRHERLAALGELAAVMAHEVRNPLGVIFNSLTTLKRLLKPTGDSEMLLNMVGEEADRLNRIVGDLLDFARPYELAKKAIAIEPVITAAIDAALQALHGNLVRVITDFPKEIPPVPVDGQMLRQAMVNLVVNAVQAMPRGGVVQVGARMEQRSGKPWLVIEVRDEGSGLSPRAAEKMFQPFFTTKATGTGLGLAVVKRIVDAHLGDIAAQPNDGRPGTTFVVRLPGTLDAREGVMTPPRPSPSVSRH